MFCLHECLHAIGMLEGHFWRNNIKALPEGFFFLDKNCFKTLINAAEKKQKTLMSSIVVKCLTTESKKKTFKA